MEVDLSHESPRKPSVGVITIQSPLGIPSRTTGNTFAQTDLSAALWEREEEIKDSFVGLSIR